MRKDIVSILLMVIGCGCVAAGSHFNIWPLEPLGGLIVGATIVRL